MPASLRKEVESLRARVSALTPSGVKSPGGIDPAWHSDPIRYASERLGVAWWAKQEEVARAYVDHDKVFVKASHGVGKTHLAGGLISHHHDCFDPGIVLTTAPTARQVYDLTWKEVRLQRRGRDMLPRAPRIVGKFPDGRFNPAHYAAGYTATDANSFQGSHEENLFILIEEATGVGEEIWQGAEGMLSSGHGNKILAILNPTDPSCPARMRERAGGWHVITISALDHPNIAAQLRGRPKPFPKAIDLTWLEDKLHKWCTPILAADARPTDLQWPPEDFCRERGIEPKWFRPGPLFEGKVLGRWPTLTVNAVWSDFAWDQTLRVLPDSGPLQIGCDVARFGDDSTVIHVRKGGASLHHEAGNGRPTTTTADRLKMTAHEWGEKYGVRPQAIPIAVDDCGVGGGVTDQLARDGWHVVPVNTAWSLDWFQDEYPNLRSALWFGLAEQAAEGNVSFARLSQQARDDLRVDLQSPVYVVDARGRRVVEPKERTKERLSRSPDHADGAMLAYANVNTLPERVAGRIIVP